ncbi:MAG: flavodoxin [Proteobacteria bacterium]|nr:flavodoxin [Pseudomonadota bacterium]
MKILITYFSQTGNTEKIARAIGEIAAQSDETEIKKMEEVDAASVSGYDFIFLGSPLHASNLAGPVKKFLENLQAGAGQKLAGFITHFAPAYPDQAMDGFVEPIKAACADKGIEFKGCFDCQGALTESLHEMVQKSQNFSDEEWAGIVKAMAGHPDAGDEAKAKEFAKEVIG